MVLSEGSTAFMMLCTSLVLFMMPGVAFFYGGMVNPGSVQTIMIQCFVTMGFITLWWWLLGFSLCFGESLGVIGKPWSQFALLNVQADEPLTFNGITIELVPGAVFCMFQLAFAILTPTLMTGAFSKKLRFKPFLIFILLWASSVYAPFAHLTWGGGLFAQWGVRDFAGGTVVHMTAGWSALACLFVLEKESILEGDEDEPKNEPYMLLGTAFLWFGWFGFNSGSAYGAMATSVAALLNTQLAAGTGLATWVLLDCLLAGAPSIVGSCFGVVAGLVAITPSAGHVTTWAAMALGALASLMCRCSCELPETYCPPWMHETIEVWSTHGVGGLVGCIAVGFLSIPTECDIASSMSPLWCVSSHTATRSFEQTGKQAAAALIVAMYSFAMTFVLLKGLGCFMRLKPKEDSTNWMDFEPHTPRKVFGNSVEP